jgi:hypothetical protein
MTSGSYTPFRSALLILCVCIAGLVGLQKTGIIQQALANASGMTVDGMPTGTTSLSLGGGIDSGTLAQIVTRFSQHPAAVNCGLPDSGEVFGETDMNSRAISLIPNVCSGLGYVKHGLSAAEWRCVYAAAALCDPAVNWSLQSMQVVAHESYHAYGISSESDTDCYAFQAVYDVALMLGVPSDAAHALARYHLAHYDIIRGAPPEYQLTGDCRDGGRLDLRPTQTGWPD